MPLSQLVPQCSSALASEHNSLADAETYLLTSAGFEAEFAAALQAEPGSQAVPPIIANAPEVPSVLRYSVAGEIADVPAPPIVTASNETAGLAASQFVPLNIFSATLHALVCPFRTTLAREMVRLLPTWGSSTLVHLLLVLGLALLVHHETRSPLPTILELTITEAASLGEPDDLDQDSLLPLPAMLPVTIDAPEVAETLTEVGDVLAAPETPLTTKPETLPTSFNELAATPLKSGPKRGTPEAKADKTGKGIIELAENETSFFGIKGQGKKFCFVVDNSKSMNGTRFRAALGELMYSIEKLQPDQVFYVVFFSDGAYPLFFPNIAPAMIPATAQNKAKFRAWLQFVEMGPATFGSAAMKIALDLDPEIVFLLGDGDFQDDTVREVLRRASAKTRIHTIGLDIAPRSRADAGFAAIARAFYGTYRNVRLTP